MSDAQAKLDGRGLGGSSTGLPRPSLHKEQVRHSEGSGSRIWFKDPLSSLVGDVHARGVQPGSLAPPTSPSGSSGGFSGDPEELDSSGSEEEEQCSYRIPPGWDGTEEGLAWHKEAEDSLLEDSEEEGDISYPDADKNEENFFQTKKINAVGKEEDKKSVDPQKASKQETLSEEDIAFCLAQLSKIGREQRRRAAEKEGLDQESQRVSNVNNPACGPYQNVGQCYPCTHEQPQPMLHFLCGRNWDSRSSGAAAGVALHVRSHRSTAQCLPHVEQSNRNDSDTGIQHDANKNSS